MQQTWLRIISNKHRPLHWPVLIVLWLISVLYGAALAVRSIFIRAKVRTKAPVVSVGNITVGGSGKTPMVIVIARYYSELGKVVAIVSSGYGRESNADILTIGREIIEKGAIETGDEIMMMAEVLPEVFFAVSNSKNRAAQLADRQFKPEVIVVDDGFQHRWLHRDFDILLVDATLDLRRESLFPLGRRREPLRCIRRADAVVLTRANLARDISDYRDWIGTLTGGGEISEVQFINEEIRLKDRRLPLAEISGKSVYFFAGIGGFDVLLNHLKSRLDNIVGFRQFPDHCCYRPRQTELIKADIDRLDPDFIVTTHKDYVKISCFDFGQPIYYLDLKLNFTSGGEKLLESLTGIVEK